ncbi:hypothetical protein BDZ97DRAFT_1758647 [Flammula alnicola]|nr:hypothetical protein BDZ97DRAFT_1758647 [Flammula alnicola]
MRQLRSRFGGRCCRGRLGQRLGGGGGGGGKNEVQLFRSQCIPTDIDFELQCRTADGTLIPASRVWVWLGYRFSYHTRTPAYPSPVPTRVSVPVSITRAEDRLCGADFWECRVKGRHKSVELGVQDGQQAHWRIQWRGRVQVGWERGLLIRRRRQFSWDCLGQLSIAPPYTEDCLRRQSFTEPIFTSAEVVGAAWFRGGGPNGDRSRFCLC